MAAEVICADCGFRGIASLEMFRRLHLVFHDEHLNGVKLRRLEQFERVGSIDGLDVLLIRPDSTRFSRLRAERVSRRAIAEPLEEGGYDKPMFYAESVYQIVPEHAAHALILAREARGVGMLVFERRYRAARYHWESATHRYAIHDDSKAGPTWAFVHIWLLPSLRGKNIGLRLVKFATEGIPVAAESIAWLTPFTSRGFALVRRFSPESVWAAGHETPGEDTYALPFAR
jgi:GNAT superfamily N-acetyltransferase